MIKNFSSIKNQYSVLFSIILIFLAIALNFSSCNNSDSVESDTVETSASKKTDPALQTINNQIAADSSNATAWYARGRYYLNRKQFIESISDLTKAVSLDSTKAEYYLTLSDAYFFTNQTFSTKTALEKSLTIDPNNEQANFKLGELLFFVKRYDDAMKYVAKVVELNPKNLRAYFLQGMIKKEAGDTATSLKYFQDCIEKDPGYYDAYMQLGILNSARNNKLALQYFNQALKIKPESEEAFYGKALFEQNNQDYDAAIQDYTNILQINPRNRDANFNLGYIHQVNLKVYSEAIKHYNNALKYDSLDFKSYYNRGLCFESTGDINRAKQDFQKAIDIMPSYEKARDGLKRVMR